MALGDPGQLLGVEERRGVSLLDVVGLLARLALGGVLVVAGALKVTNPAASALAVRAYQILPYDLAGYLAFALPMVEIIVGTLLALGLLTRPSAIAGGLLMVAFLVGIISVWVRGISIDCGCFGGGGAVSASQTQYIPETVRDAGLLLCGAFLAWRPRTAYSLDTRLFG